MVRARKHLRGTALLSRSICIGGPAIGLRCSSWKTSDHSDSIRRVARMLRVWRTHHPYADFFFFLLTRFLIAHATNTKTQMKKNEPSGLLFTSSLLAKSGLKHTPLCREATRCKHRYRARTPSRSTFDFGIGSTSPGRAPRPSH